MDPPWSKHLSNWPLWIAINIKLRYLYFTIIFRWYHEPPKKKDPIQKKKSLKKPKPFLYKNGILLQSITDKWTSFGKWRSDFFKNCYFSFKRERRILFITLKMFNSYWYMKICFYIRGTTGKFIRSYSVLCCYLCFRKWRF